MSKSYYMVTHCQGLCVIETTDEEIREWFIRINNDPDQIQDLVKDIRILKLPIMTLEEVDGLFLLR